MQYKSENEKVAMMPTHGLFVSKRLSPAEDPQIQRTRKILVIILSIFLSFAVSSLIFGSLGTSIESDRLYIRRSQQISQAVFSIVFYGFGLFVAQRYSATGLRVFAWLNIILFALSIIIIALLVLFLIFGASVLRSLSDDSDMANFTDALLSSLPTPVIIILVIAYMIAFIVAMVIIKLCFKLARLIDGNRSLAIQQI